MSTLKVTNLQHPSSTTNNLVLASDGTCSAGSHLTTTSSAVNLNGTTGTLFSSIPNKVSQIRITFAALSTSATVRFRLQLGDSGGIESSGYVFNSTYHGLGQGQFNTVNESGFTSGNWSAASNLYTGYFLINRLTDQATTSNVIYVCNGGFETQSGGYNTVLNGRKELSGEIDRVSFNTQDGSTTFDSGTVRIDYLF